MHVVHVQNGGSTPTGLICLHSTVQRASPDTELRHHSKQRFITLQLSYSAELPRVSLSTAACRKSSHPHTATLRPIESVSLYMPRLFSLPSTHTTHLTHVSHTPHVYATAETCQFAFLQAAAIRFGTLCRMCTRPGPIQRASGWHSVLVDSFLHAALSMCSK